MKGIVTTVLIISASIFLFFSLPKDYPGKNFLNSLTEDQRTKVLLPFDDDSKAVWHFLPGSMFPRAGIQLAEIDAIQKEELNELLQAFLSETGYIKTRKIISLEKTLAEISGNLSMRDPEKYSVAFYGNPESDSLWAWSFEGHHVSLNFTILNGNVSIAPRFLGASPATIPSGKRKGERTLHMEEDLGLELINSLSDKQRVIAIFQQKAFHDIVTGNSAKVEPLDPVGIKYEELSPSQQAVFLNLIDEYLSTMPAEQAKRRRDSIMKEGIDQVRFGWAGATKSDEGHYYRIQGKSFLIEFDNVQQNANHIHTVWRDFDGDFGRDLIKEHYMSSDHHK